jgi:hypothetical protein
MPTLDQSFSTSNFHIIFNLLNRKGKIDVKKMSAEYQKSIVDIKDVREEIVALKKKKKTERTDEYKINLQKLNTKLLELYKEKKEQLDKNMEALSEQVNSPHFRMVMQHYTFDSHDEFTLDTKSLSVVFAIAQLQHTLKRAFDVRMYDRHTIMTALKSLLNSKMPYYLIRTDVSKFFESIPQDKLMMKIEDSALLNYKSRAFIKGILKEFEQIKVGEGITTIGTNQGVPRGVGISSMLSEIYMQDIDREFRSRTETMFYVRYVDDIILIVRSIGRYKDLEEYYNSISQLFADKGLTLKEVGDDKCKLIDFVNSPKKCNFEYLGYKIYLDPQQGIAQYDLSSSKFDKIKGRIDHAYKHFENRSKINVKAARRDLLDALNLITGNIRLKNAKSGVKTGLFYSNDLLMQSSEEMNYLNKYMHDKDILPYKGVFKTDEEYNSFVSKLKKKIDAINLAERWSQRKMYKYPIKRILEIQKWL